MYVVGFVTAPWIDGSNGSSENVLAKQPFSVP